MHLSHSCVESSIRNRSVLNPSPSLCSVCSSAPCLLSLPAMMQLRRQTLWPQLPRWGQALNVLPPRLSSFPPPACCPTRKPDVLLELCCPSDSTAEAAACCSRQKCNYRPTIYTTSLPLQLLKCHRSRPMQSCCASHWISISLMPKKSWGITT